MNNYFNQFVALSLLQCKKNDYTDKQKVATHNVATYKLQQLQSEMEQTDCKKVLCQLLSHEDDRVKINAAAFCLHTQIFTDKASCVLNKIIESSDDPTLCFSAKMVLQNSTP